MNTPNLPTDPKLLMRSIIQRIATGPDLSKDISREEAHLGTKAIIENHIDPIQVGIYFIALDVEEDFQLRQSIITKERELRAIADDPSVRVVILAAGGKGFCAGHDLKEMRAHVGDKGWQRDLFDQCGGMMMSLTTLPQPVIARSTGASSMKLALILRNSFKP